MGLAEDQQEQLHGPPFEEASETRKLSEQVRELLRTKEQQIAS